MSIDRLFIEKVKSIVYKILNKHNLLQGNWHVGKVDSIVSPIKLLAYVDGSDTSQLIACNPDVTFKPNDEIFVIFINNDSRNKFALCKRGL